MRVIVMVKSSAGESVVRWFHLLERVSRPCGGAALSETMASEATGTHSYPGNGRAPPRYRQGKTV
jgi:flavoprotein